MNGQSSNQGRKRRDLDDFSVKLSTIRIWMHEKDIGKLTRILWAGQGSRLCQQASTNPRVKRFLAAVPYVMNSIKDVHQAVIDNNLETLQAKMEPPVPPALITCRDANGLNLVHKAAGLGHTKILEYLIGIWPDGVAETDVTGKTPLHWAASHKNNMRCYTLLTEAGCDEEALDYKMKSPTYYRHKPHEIERAFLVYVPEAPRVSPDVATDWEALSEDVGDGGKKLDIKIPDTNGFHGRTTDDSIENTSEVDLNDGISATEEEQHAATITNGDGDDSAPQTPAKDEEESEAAAEQSGELEAPLRNGAVNGHEEAEVEAEIEDAEATADGDEVEANAEAGDEPDDVKVDAEVDTQAAAEVEATEAETNMKALNDTTTTTTNGSAEHAEQRESEAAATAVADSEDAADGEIVENETKSEEMRQTEQVEESNENSEEKIDVVGEANVTEENEQLEENVENQTVGEVEQKTEAKKAEEHIENQTKETEVKDNGIRAESTEGKAEEKIDSELLIEPRIESEDKPVEEIKETEVVGAAEQETTEIEANASDKEDNAKMLESKVDKVEQEVEKIEDPKTDLETDETKESVEGAVDEIATTRTTEEVKEIVKGVNENVDIIIEEGEEVNKDQDGKENLIENDNEDTKENEAEEKANGKERSDNEKVIENTTSKSVAEERNTADNDEEIQKNNETKEDEAKVAQEHILLKDKEEDNAEKTTERTTEGEQENKKDEDIETPSIAAKETNGISVIMQEKTDLGQEKEEENKGENKIEDNISENNQSKTENDEDAINNDTNRTQPDTTTKAPPEVSKENNEDNEKTTQDATNANDKTEAADVSKETKPEILEINEKTTTENVMPQNGENNVMPEQQNEETGEMANKEKLETIEEHAAGNRAEVSGKLPRLTTAKVSRGKRNGSGKRADSGKKKSDTLMEGENESEGEYDEDEEDEVQYGML